MMYGLTICAERREVRAIPTDSGALSVSEVFEFGRFATHRRVVDPA